MTRYGNFRVKLNVSRLVVSPECVWCDVDETTEFVLWECCRFEEDRREFMDDGAVENLGLKEVLENGCRMQSYVVKWIVRRKEMEEQRRRR